MLTKFEAGEAWITLTASAVWVWAGFESPSYFFVETRFHNVSFLDLIFEVSIVCPRGGADPTTSCTASTPTT